MDDNADVFVNGVKVLRVVWRKVFEVFIIPSEVNLNTCGENTLRIVATNTGGPGSVQYILSQTD